MILSKSRLPDIAHQITHNNVHLELSLQGDILWADKNFLEKVSQSSLDEVTGVPFYKYINDKFDSTPSLKDILEIVEKKGKWIGLLWPLDNKGNISCINFEFTLKESGKQKTVISTGYDVTDTIHYYNELLLINEDLGEARDNFFKALSNAEVSLWEVPDLSKDFLWWSENFFSELGYDIDDFQPSITKVKSMLYSDDVPKLEEGLKLSNEVFKLSLRIKKKNGDYNWYRFSGTVYQDTRNGCLAASGTINNIHSKKLTEEQLSISLEELEKFAYIVSHDLQTPLRHISTYAAMILEELGPDKLNKETSEMFDYMVRSTSHMKKMIEDLLHFSRVGRSTDDFVPIKGERLRMDLIDMFKPEIDSNKIELEIGPIPNFKAREIQIRQVFQNFIENAMKYATKEEEKAVRIEISAEVKKDFVVFSILDNGPGIKDKFKSQVFDVFKTLNATKRTALSSTGIGLSIVRRIAKFHGGSAWVEDGPAGGCLFKFTIKN